MHTVLVSTWGEFFEKVEDQMEMVHEFRQGLEWPSMDDEELMYLNEDQINNTRIFEKASIIAVGSPSESLRMKRLIKKIWEKERIERLRTAYIKRILRICFKNDIRKKNRIAYGIFSKSMLMLLKGADISSITNCELVAGLVCFAYTFTFVSAISANCCSK